MCVRLYARTYVLRQCCISVLEIERYSILLNCYHMISEVILFPALFTQECNQVIFIICLNFHFGVPKEALLSMISFPASSDFSLEICCLT